MMQKLRCLLLVFVCCLLVSQCTLGLVLNKSSPTPIDPSKWPSGFPAKEHCSKCGLCETTFVSKVTDACAFLEYGMSQIDSLEVKTHGRSRDLKTMVWSSSSGSNDVPDSSSNLQADEGRFGVMYEPMKLAKGRVKDAQWTGCVTSIALSMLESRMVDAVVCIASGDNGDDASDSSFSSSWSNPQPIIAKTCEDVLRGRGVKPALAPSLRVLDDVKNDASIRRLLFCGVGCAVQAFRSVQDDLGLDEVYVLGTNCADNSPTPRAADEFIKNGVKLEGPGRVKGYEFMQDFRVHVKTDDGYYKKPYFSLPGSIAKSSIAPSCLSCFDYTNAVADVVVGYMAAPLNERMDSSYQTLTIRNERGKRMVNAALDASRIEVGDVVPGEGQFEKLASATVESDSIVLEMIGGSIKEEGLPAFIGEIMAFVMRSIGPKGVAFARYSIDYHILRNYLHVLDTWGKDRAEASLPQYAVNIVNRYLKNDLKMKSIEDKIISKN